MRALTFVFAFGLFLTSLTVSAQSNLSIAEFYDRQGFAAIVHVTDPQWTFAKREDPKGAGDQTQDGTLGVKGTGQTIGKIAGLVQAVVDSGVMKLSLSGDAHYDIEVTDASQNGEFHAPFNFPRHGMKDHPGPDGDRYIFEVEEILKTKNVVKIPAHVLNSSGDALVPAPVNLIALRKEISDIHSILRFEKNGVGSYSVFANPSYIAYLEKIDPYRVLPHIHFGWCTDFCDYHVMKRELELGYDVWFIVDAAAGVGAKTTGAAMRELIQLGLKVITTAEFNRPSNSWNRKGADWRVVRKDLEELRRTSDTPERLKTELLLLRYQEPKFPGDLGETCVVLLSKS